MMNKKLAIIYGIAILLLGVIQISTFFTNKKVPKSDVATSVPTVSIELLMRALNLNWYSIKIEDIEQQKDQGIFFEVLDNSGVITSKQICSLKHCSPDTNGLFYVFIKTNDDNFEFTLINGGNQNSWKEKRLPKEPGFVYTHVFEGISKSLKFGEVFSHEAFVEIFNSNEGKCQKFRFMKKKNTFPE